ncbi:MAG: hypothetical protein HY883_07690, partial [Deltaproteobacteria bacterium]|nr:hypothetical protein [Deltaproteobacteria bacterium]
MFKFLGISSMAFLLGRRSAMGQVFYRPEKKEIARSAKNIFTDGERALIGVAADKPPKEMVKEAVSLIGGFEKLGLEGKTVLVKPNVVSGERNPVTTNPQVVRAV